MEVRKVMRWELPERKAGMLSAPGLAEGYVETSKGKAKIFIHATECEIHGDDEAWDGSAEIEIWMNVRFGDVIFPCDVGDALSEKVSEFAASIGVSDVFWDDLKVKDTGGLRLVVVFGRKADEVDQAGFEQIAKDTRIKLIEQLGWNREAFDKDVVYSESEIPEEE